ncbi:hypothetical protein Mp_1g28030 [Marchantia polymorpha subsp. ruderalis]|uniref:Rab-GAP TBC domain-containing protein n=2 Tax=Marchantia polymorpha TaxID=3197 RepID=A0AAF6AV34_MARPO|nr:hypothetical protein MARPO_0002s0075 [Marchantia polymorpha]BBN00305.1 hypothetical protein Mp_1g28030 [Marchantia polymorpha subsp. ruderalis]|eukprot:PTQ49577.1 hypothetical protein MARPO_0002s0075 [Marchantia polymorpha]
MRMHRRQQQQQPKQQSRAEEAIADEWQSKAKQSKAGGHARAERDEGGGEEERERVSRSEDEREARRGPSAGWVGARRDGLRNDGGVSVKGGSGGAGGCKGSRKEREALGRGKRAESVTPSSCARVGSGEEEEDMPQSQNGLSAETEEAGGCANGSDDESINGGLKGSPRWSRVSSGTKGWRLRGVEWRVKLGVLPGSAASVDAMRRATADGRRRYADLRRRLLVDPHIMDDDEEDTSMDNPLSLDPESVWGRYFRNAELEKTIDKDLTRLYPEHGIFFQSAPCQAMMRRILLVWSLIHPQFSYRQGMHELLAPLLYVLHVDVVRLSQVKHRFEDLFDDRFDSLSLQEDHVRDKVESAKKFVGEMIIAGDSINFDDKGQKTADPAADSDEKRVDLSVIVQGSDMYGVEGELGALLSARFLEHDAYCMLDAMLIGQGGAVSMAAYFSSPPGVSVPPVIEASAALYRTLAAADISLYTHLVELGVEPQFFALRWLRLLFGREFILEDLLRVWDAILTADNTPLFVEDGDEDSCILRFSQRSALISSMAVSMLLYVRPALLAAPDATACLQRLLNFPQIPDVRNLIDSARSLQPLARAAERSPTPTVPRSTRASEISRNGKHARSGSISPPTTTHHVMRHQKSASCSPDVLRVSMSLPGSYWEEKWTHSVLQRKSPEELFSPRTSKLEAVVRNQENVDRDTSSAMLSRSVSEGRHQLNLPLAQSAVAQPASGSPDTSQDSSDEEGREMLGRSEKAPGVTRDSKDSSAESVASTSDCDGSRDSDSEGQELLSHRRASTDEEGSATSPALRLKLSCADSCLEDENPGSPQETKINSCVTSGCCQKPDEQKKSSSAKPCQRRVSSDSQLPVSGSGGTLESDVKPRNVSSSTQMGIETEAVRLGAENGSVCLPVSSSNSPLHEESTKVKSPCVSDSQLRMGIVSSASCENLKSQDAESTRTSQSPLPESVVEGQGGDRSGVEDTSRSVDSSPLPSKFKAEAPTAQPARLGRLNWVWSLGRASFGDKTAPSKIETTTSSVVHPTSGNVSDTEGLGSPLANGVRKPKRWWRSNNDVVPEEFVATTSSDDSIAAEHSAVTLQVDDVKNTNESVFIGSGVLQKEDVSVETQVTSQEAVKKPKEKTPSAALQALGQAMLEHVQVLESSLAQKASVLGMETMMWTPAVREKSEGTRSSLGGKSQAAALAAIAELRKISNALQQM